MKQSTRMIFVAALFVIARASSAASCYDVSKGQPTLLSGVLHYAMFPGPPGYEDINKGDTPEPGYILDLFKPICITGDDSADPSSLFSSVHVVGTKATASQLKRLDGQRVTVSLIDQMGAHTGHHRRPLVAWVSAIQPLASLPMEFTDEYGTAATVVRAFYYALQDGQGATASSMVVPEKRVRGPFSAAALTRFYGLLKTPLSFESISQLSNAQYFVKYKYVSGNNFCKGEAVVTTTKRQGRFLIQAIRSLSGC